MKKALSGAALSQYVKARLLDASMGSDHAGLAALHRKDVERLAGAFRRKNYSRKNLSDALESLEGMEWEARLAMESAKRARKMFLMALRKMKAAGVDSVRVV